MLRIYRTVSAGFANELGKVLLDSLFTAGAKIRRTRLNAITILHATEDGASMSVSESLSPVRFRCCSLADCTQEIPALLLVAVGIRKYGWDCNNVVLFYGVGVSDHTFFHIS